MNSLCPFFKTNCHGNECVMWRDEQCIIVNFLQGFQQDASEIASAISPEQSIEIDTKLHSRESEKVPKWLKIATPEALAKEMLEFRDDQFPKDEKVRFYQLSHLFWNTKGVETFFLPSDVRLKVEQADIIARRQIEKEEIDQKKARLALEKEELPSLVCKCVDWARITGLKRLTLTDVETFVLEKDLDVLKETKKALYSMANLNLKTGK